MCFLTDRVMVADKQAAQHAEATLGLGQEDCQDLIRRVAPDLRDEFIDRGPVDNHGFSDAVRIPAVAQDDRASRFASQRPQDGFG